MKFRSKKITLSLFLTLGMPIAWGQTEDIGKVRKQGIDVVQQRVFTKGMRHEIAADVGLILDNTWLNYQLLQAKYTFHFRESIGFEVYYGHAWNQNKSVVGNLASIPCPSPTSDLDGDGNPDANCGVTLNPPPDPLKNLYMANLVWSPIYGKFALFSRSILHFDFFLVAGAGMFDNVNSNRFAFDVGVGAKVFVNDWMAVRAELRNFTVREGAPFNQITNMRIISFGVSGFLPTRKVR